MTKAEDHSAFAATPQRPRLLLAFSVIMAALAGWVDAIGFVQFHGLFVSFMSGNSTQAAVAFVQRDFAQAIEFGRTIALFVMGVVVGELIAVVGGNRVRLLVLGCESVCLGLCALAARFQFGDIILSSLLAFAMGLQNAVLHKVGDINVGLTYVTGTLVQVGRNLASALRGEGGLRKASLLFGLWGGLVCGGLSGAAMLSALSLATALAAAAGLCTALLIWTTLQRAVLAGGSAATTPKS